MGKFKVGDRVRVRKYWPGEMATVIALPEDITAFNDHFRLRGDVNGNGVFGRDDFELVERVNDGGQIIPDTGTTLLDQFAMAALTGLLSNPADVPGLLSVDGVQKRYAELSFGYAQAMMKAREVQK